jgi:hypothetical protein
MDPGVLAMITLLCPFFGSFAGAITVIGASKQGITGGFRGDNSGLISYLMWGGACTALIFTAPLYLPGVVGALHLVAW